jgi:Uma2 family endonuclease
VRTEKHVQYQKHPTVEEYILVSQDRQAVEIYTRNGKKWVYQMFESGEEIELTSINFRCPIEAFYEDVPWSQELE